MGIVFRQSVKTSIVVLGGALLGALVIWLSAKYIVDKQHFGFTRNLTNNAVIVSQMLMLGMSSTLFVFTHRYATDSEKRKVLTTLCLSIPLIAVLLFTLVYFFFKEWVLQHFQPGDVPLMRAYFNWLPLYALLFLYMTLLEQYLGSQMKVALSAFMREILLRILNCVLILLFAFNYVSFHTLVTGTVLIYLVPVLVFFFISSGTDGFGVSFKFHLFRKADYREMLHFAWYHFLLSISVILMSSLDMTMIPFYDYKGFNSVAVYSIAVYVISFLQMPYKAFLPASFSILTKAFADNDIEKARDIFSRASINLFIPTVAICIILCCNLDNAVAIIGNGRNYADMIPVVLILMFGQMLNISSGMTDQVLSITNYYKFTFYISLAISVILYVLLRFSIPRYGIYGAAYSNGIALVIYSIAKLLFIHRKLAMSPYSSKTLLVVFAGIPAFLAGHFFPHLFNADRHAYVHTFFDAAMRVAVIVVVFVLMLLWLKPSIDLEQYIASIRKNKRLF